VLTRARTLPLVALLVLSACSASPDEGDPCQPDDADGVIGGIDVFAITVTDEEFTPKILSSQNRSSVTLKLENQGTTPHGFTIACLPTPNSDGCPEESCFPDASALAPVDPGESATAQFEVPLVEGIYAITTGVDGDAFEAQFIVQ
jgi:hypothetical protein